MHKTILQIFSTIPWTLTRGYFFHTPKHTCLLISPTRMTPFLHLFAEMKLPVSLSFSPCVLVVVYSCPHCFCTLTHSHTLSRLHARALSLSLHSFIHLNHYIQKAQSSPALGTKTINLNKNQHLFTFPAFQKGFQFKWGWRNTTLGWF